MLGSPLPEGWVGGRLLHVLFVSVFYFVFFRGDFEGEIGRDNSICLSGAPGLRPITSIRLLFGTRAPVDGVMPGRIVSAASS